ncbi:chitin synthase III catalytic subunit [Coemansia mojavensis]|nr:chitin synthase III catalytic subunit [Coemansia mojavensis]
MRYGDFASICERSAVPVCRLFGNAVLPSCYLNVYSAKSALFVNLPDFVISIIAFFFIAYLAFRAHRKIDAVGRREMTLLLSFFCIMLAFNIAGADLIHGSSLVNKWLGVVNTALVVSFFWALILFGAVGFQIMADGSLKSMLTIIGTSLIILISMGYIAADTALGISDGLKPKPSDPLYSPGVFTIYLVFPLVAIVIFGLLQMTIVIKFLSARLPMVWLLCAFICFAAGQAIMFGASKKMCESTNRRIDGAFFATLLDTAAMSCVYGFWSAITVDDSNVYEEEEYKF